MLITLAALLMSVPPLAPGAWREAKNQLEVTSKYAAVVSYIDISAATARIRNTTCRGARLFFDDVVEIRAQQKPLVSAKAVGKDRAGKPCIVPVIVVVGWAALPKPPGALPEPLPKSDGDAQVAGLH